ncbi:MAG: hypothetical protein M3Z25_03815 [Actinomycetota bacterium]|nr:hypothetical protein [Actinomycetota bacterium]
MFSQFMPLSRLVHNRPTRTESPYASFAVPPATVPVTQVRKSAASAAPTAIELKLRATGQSPRGLGGGDL